MKAHKIIKSILALALAVIAVASCQEKMKGFGFTKGEAVKFSIGTAGNGTDTKAAYSGVSASNKERIDWQAGDLIRIWCDAVSEPTSKYADYAVTSVEASGAISKGHIKGTGEILCWGSESDSHVFYGMFPSPAVAGDGTSLGNGSLVGFIPTTQKPVSLNAVAASTAPDFTAVADLTSEYMAAKNTVAAGTQTVDGNVFLNFKPFVTAIEFTISNGFSTDGSLYIKNIQLISTSYDIAGAFTADLTGLAADGTNYPICTSTATGKAVTMDFTDIPGYDYSENEEISGSKKYITLTKGQSLRFTVFLKPNYASGAAVDVDDITFRINKAEGTWMSTRLGYTDGSGVVFPTHKKSFVTGLLVPEGAQWTVKYGPDVQSWNTNDTPIGPAPEISMDPFVTSWNTGIGGDLEMTECSFVFNLTEESQSNQFYMNSKEDSSPVSIEITSTKENSVAGKTDEDWIIQSYQIGTANPVAVDGVSFTAGGLAVAKNGKALEVKALKRTAVKPGSHSYWVNAEPGRTDYLDWSPADWTTETADEPIDLSTFNFSTETFDNPMTTANCYIIRHAGTYKLPLIYANAVVQGRVSEIILVNHLGTHIGNTLSPTFNKGFIENNEGCTAQSCEIVWQDEAEVIKDVSIVGEKQEMGEYDATNVRFIKFTVDREAICQNNAVIAVKDANGLIMWSWHIWITNDPALLGDAIPVRNHAGEIAEFFPLNCLGWIDGKKYLARDNVVITLEQASSGKTIKVNVFQPAVSELSNGNYYQYGRKDPMCRKDLPVKGKFLKNNSETGEIATTIINPNTFYALFKDGGWGRDYRKFDDDEMKGIYFIYKASSDPSPAGYWMPGGGVFSGFTTTGEIATTESQFNVSGSFINGWNYLTGDGNKTIFFPASGYRNYTNGNLENIGNNGSCWSQYLIRYYSGHEECRALYFDYQYVNPTGTYSPSYALPVRPVKE